MKVLLTGANGQLGRALVSSKPVNIDLIKTTRKEFDLLDKENCIKFIKEHKPDWIINAAAFTDVEKAEKEKNLAYKINTEGPKIVSEALLETRGRLLHISTDYVFSGKATTPYKTDALRSPISFYGFSKASAEKEIENLLFKSNKAVILRTSWLISSYGQNFLTKMLNLQNKLSSLSIVSDQIGCITSTNSLANICWLVVSSGSDVPRILHWSEMGKTNWFEIALEINKVAYELGIINNKPNFLPIKSKNYKTLAQRPKFSLLDITETENFFKIKSNNWKDTLKNILLEIKS